MDKIARRERAKAIVFKDFKRKYASLLDVLGKNGFARIDSLPSAEMAIDFESFDDYLMRLSHATRYDLRRKFRKTEGLRLEMEVRGSLEDEMLSQVYGLYQQQVKRHREIGFEVVPAEFFKHVSENMPDKTKFLLWRVDKKLVAFVFGLMSADFFSGYYLGLDYSVAHKYHLYFLRFRDMMNWFIANGIKRCDMGVTGYEPKKRLDFSFAPLYIYVKYRNPVIRPLFNIFCNALRFERSDPFLKEIKRRYR
jgi:predicted N-acyltransferase